MNLSTKNPLLLRLMCNLLVPGEDELPGVGRPTAGITRSLPTEEGPHRRQFGAFCDNAVFEAQQLDLHAIANVRVIWMIHRVGYGIEPLAIPGDMRKPVLCVLTIGDLLGQSVIRPCAVYWHAPSIPRA